ncbi:hypothetical protein LTR56_027674 [Elasticomyces elasticus]|nr:hypothetical protein LTR56_027674 [Elasticomyces elasticus]KAK3620231.1 hypothetical protein LTR22_025671 [Elasticomyces elasticus]KAK4895071.1 hypothetical protein LTR49_028317 [Elasticomyces elasticus]
MRLISSLAICAFAITVGPLSSQGRAQNLTTGYNTLTAQPCAQLSATAVQNVTNFVAGIAMACLQSIPVNVSGDVEVINGLTMLLRSQSTLPYLKNPPPGYLYPGVDVLGSLDSILADLEVETYASEYDVQMDLYNLVNSAYDFHFTWIPDVVAVFSWNRKGGLISVSSDGLSLPDVSRSVDFPALVASSSSSYQTSPITLINGVDVESWLNAFAAVNPYDHDPDANYDNIMFDVPRIAMSDSSNGGGAFLGGFVYQGNDTVMTFANGTVRRIPTYAETSCDLSRVTDGVSFFQKCKAASSPNQSVSNSTKVTTENSYTPVPTSDPS